MLLLFLHLYNPQLLITNTGHAYLFYAIYTPPNDGIGYADGGCLVPNCDVVITSDGSICSGQ